MSTWTTHHGDLHDQVDKFIMDIAINGYSHSLLKTRTTDFRDIPSSDMNLWGDVSVLISENPDLGASKAVWDYRKTELLYSSKARDAVIAMLSHGLKIHSRHIRYEMYFKGLPQYLALRWLPFEMIEKHALLYIQDTPAKTDKQRKKE